MLNVIVVGAGITGLSAAISLRRVGHAARVLERSALSSEFGAAMTITPNASRPLLAWGIDPQRNRYDVTRGVRLFAGNTLRETKLPIPMGERAAARFGAPSFFAHRVDFHESLRRMAMQSTGPGPPATLHINSDVVKFDVEFASVTLSSGEVFRGDVIIAADGLHSRAVETVLGHENHPEPLPSVILDRPYQNSCFRFLIPAAVLQNDPATRWWNEECDSHLRVYTGPTQLVTYPCRQGELFNFVCMYYNKALGASDSDDWSLPVDKETLAAHITWFHPELQNVLMKSNRIRCWPLLYRPPVPTWRKGRLVLAGDAAHPMLPHYGQGGAMGIEDAVALGVSLAGAAPGDVEERLELYEEIRRTRATVFQMLSCTGQENVAHISAEAAKLMSGVPKIPPEIPDFTQGYDIIHESVKYMKERLPGFELPATYLEK